MKPADVLRQTMLWGLGLVEREGPVRWVRIGPVPEHLKSDVPCWAGVVFTRACKAFCPSDLPIVAGRLQLPEDTWIVGGVGDVQLCRLVIPSFAV